MRFQEEGVRVLSYLKRPILPVLFFLALYTPAFAETESICYGTTAQGKLENGWQLPSSGANYEAYSLIGVAAGRNYVHSSVYHAVEDAYRLLESTQPNKHFVYGETGWANGGTFKPHKTHQNGLSVDFFVPVTNNKGQSVALPTKVKGMFRDSLNIDLPDIGDIYKKVFIRHDLIHRNGKNKDGVEHIIAEDKITQFCDEVTAFVDEANVMLKNV